MSCKFRRVVKTKDSIPQPHQVALIGIGISIISLVLSFIIYVFLHKINNIYFNSDSLINITSNFMIFNFIFILFLICLYYLLNNKRDRLTNFEVDNMNLEASKTSKELLKLFNDKNIIDILKLSKLTRYGHEMPQVFVYVDNSLDEGYIAIENICNYDLLDKSKFNEILAGLFKWKFNNYAIVDSHLTQSNSYVIFEFEDTTKSHRFIINNDSDIELYVSENKHHLKLSNDLVWLSDQSPHLSIIARTRTGKSVLAGRYLAQLMSMQGWAVDYNSAKPDIYVKKHNGKSDIEDIVERCEYWVSIMNSRLEFINKSGKEKYLDIDDMVDVAVFFDEIGNLNAGLESDRALKSRWVKSINKLAATGGSAGIHIIAISQYATIEAFLPGLARVNCSDCVIMLGGSANSADERRFLVPGSDVPSRKYGKGQGLARFITSGSKWENLHYFEAPYFTDYDK